MESSRVRISRNRAGVAGLAATASLVLAACGTTAPRVVTDAAARAPECRTVAWAPADERPLTMVDQQVRDLLLETLQGKGYALGADGADCLVYHRFGTGQAAPRSGPSVGLGIGGGSRRVGGGVGLSFPVGGGARTGAQLVVDVVDASRNEQVWGGTADLTLAGQQPTRAELADAVSRLLYQFPDRR